MDVEEDKPLNNNSPPPPPSPSHKNDDLAEFSYSPASPSNYPAPPPSSPHKDALIVVDSPVNTATSDYKKWADMALEYYNQKNGTDYQVVDALARKAFFGHWSHCNFTAKPLNGDGDIPPKLFFAEVRRVRKDSPARKDSHTYTWFVNACIVLDGETIEGCAYCTDTFHPMDGCSHGLHRSKRKGLPPIVHCSLSDYDKRCRRVEIAYVQQGKRWRSVDGKYTSRMFFAEMFEDVSSYGPMLEHLTVTACVNMEGLQVDAGCRFCSNVIHPPPCIS